MGKPLELVSNEVQSISITDYLEKENNINVSAQISYIKDFQHYIFEKNTTNPTLSIFKCIVLFLDEYRQTLSDMVLLHRLSRRKYQLINSAIMRYINYLANDNRIPDNFKMTLIHNITKIHKFILY